MRIDIVTDRVVHVTLSRANLQDLLDALDVGNTGITLSRSFGPGEQGLIVAVEENAVHYPAQRVVLDDPYCKYHDIYNCWFNHA